MVEKNRDYLFILLCFILFSSCGTNDKKRIIGKWQSDNDWFEYVNDSMYNSGKYDIQMVSNFKYTIDPKSNELNMYTDKQSQTFYLKYKFFGNDTLGIRNVMSSDSTWIKFVKQPSEIASKK